MAAHKPVTLRWRCANAACRVWNYTGAADAGGDLACRGCGGRSELRPDPDLTRGASIHSCLVCGGREFFIRKDFPQRVGLALVVVFGLASSVNLYYKEVLSAFATLGGLVLIDAVIYLLVGRVTVCYRCRAEYRGLAYNPDHTGFDLATSEKYEVS